MLITMLADNPRLLPMVVQNTPVWVWGLLFGLTALGLSQLRTRWMGVRRLVVMPLVMTLLSLLGTVSAFAAQPTLAMALLAWATGLVFTAWAGSRLLPAVLLPVDRGDRSVQVPGSALPLVLMLSIFLVKYVVGVDLAMTPTLGSQPTYTVVVGLLYGVFSGVFACRAWRLTASLRSASHATVFKLA